MVPVYGSQLDEHKKYDDTSNVHACESVLKVLKELLFKLSPVREPTHWSCLVNQVLNLRARDSFRHRCTL